MCQPLLDCSAVAMQIILCRVQLYQRVYWSFMQFNQWASNSLRQSPTLLAYVWTIHTNKTTRAMEILSKLGTKKIRKCTSCLVSLSKSFYASDQCSQAGSIFTTQPVIYANHPVVFDTRSHHILHSNLKRLLCANLGDLGASQNSWKSWNRFCIYAQCAAQMFPRYQSNQIQLLNRWRP